MTRRLLKIGLFFALGLGLTTASAAERETPSSRQQVTLTFAPAVKQAAPAVVNIYTRKVVQNQAPALLNDPFFRQFFGDQLAPFARERVQNSLGSGVIVRSTGIVITNNHVASDADQINVVLSDRREYAAKIIGKDPRSDLAVLQLQGVTEALPALDFAESDDVEVGDLVLAIGNPFGVGQTVTSGIVSALARTTVGVSDFRSFIQTDAAINPGNSGGALITSDGRLIGINTAIYSGNGGSVGIGFAIPANMVRAILSGILKDGRAVRAWLGASGKSVTADLARNLGLQRPSGVIVDRITAGGPIDRAGIVVGDIVRSVNGHEVSDIDELRYRFATLEVGGRASVEVIRNGTAKTVQVGLLAAPDKPARDMRQLIGPHPFAGATAINLNPAVADELGRDYDDPGVVITSVNEGDNASRVGLKPGDVILTVNENKIASVSDLVAYTGQRQRLWTIAIQRDGKVFQFQVGG